MFKQKRYQEAIDFYSKAITIDQSISVLYSNRAMCHKLLGMYENCKADAIVAIELDD